MNLRTPTELLKEIKQFTQEGEIALAKRLGASQPTVNRILRGQSNCSSRVLLAIQHAHADLLGGGAGAPPIPETESATDDVQPPAGAERHSKK